MPTVYTLWKNGELLPFLSTPSAVIPVLVGGADLMIPGGQSVFLRVNMSIAGVSLALPVNSCNR